MLLDVHYRVMAHLGSLESTQEARVTLGYRLGQLLRFRRASQTSRVLHNSIVHAQSMNQLLNKICGKHLLLTRNFARDLSSLFCMHVPFPMALI